MEERKEQVSRKTFHFKDLFINLKVTVTKREPGLYMVGRGHALGMFYVAFSMATCGEWISSGGAGMQACTHKGCWHGRL